MSLLDIFQAIQDSTVGTAILESQYAFPIIESAHVLGLALSVGLLAIADFRLIGTFMRHEPVSESLQQLRPWMLAGFVIMFVSGGLLFWAEAAKAYLNPMFRIKMVFLFLAGVNALYFELNLGRRLAGWNHRAKPPWGAKFAGWTSLLCWTVVILCGRWVAYKL
jgi:hypothetical protein